MHFVTTYRVKPYLNKEDRRELMSVFARVGEGPGVSAHYAAADGSHGLVISESDDLGPAYENLQNYLQWIEYDTTPVLKIADAVPLIMAGLS
jgi:hypothetical protein